MLIYTGANTIFNHEYKKELQELISKEEQKEKKQNEEGINQKINSSILMDILEMINCTLTTGIVIFYILSTYTYPEKSETNKKINLVINKIEIYMVIFFGVHFIFKLWVNQQKISFLLELTTLVDIVTIFMISFAKTDYISYRYKFFFRIFRMVRIIYLFKVEYLLQKVSNETTIVFIKLLKAVVSLVFISVSLILEIENFNFRTVYGNESINSPMVAYNGKSLESILRFHDVVYFAYISLTTVGFGDITTKNWIARYVLIFTVLSFNIYVKPLSNKLSALLERTKYSKMKYVTNSKKTKHILILGECGIESYLAFLEELYNADHGQTNHDIIIMQRKQNKELMNLIKSFSYSSKIFYFVGNSLMEKDLKRCQAESSICVVILANRLAKDKKKEDFSNIMKAFSIKKFHSIFWQKKEGSIHICIQLLLPETKEMCYSSLISEDEINSGSAQIICVEEIKLQLLSKSCLCPGIITIIASLITSKKPTFEENYDLSSVERYKWIREYLNGIQQEIYFIKLKAELMHNMKFIDIVKLVYKVSGLVVIGIDVIVDDYKPIVCLNPSNYLIAPFDTLIYVLADSQPNEEELNNLISDYLEKQNKGVVAKNKEMTKLLRLKNVFWNKIANFPDYYHNQEMQSSLGIKFNDQNTGNTFKNLVHKKNKDFSQLSFKNKNWLLMKQGSYNSNYDTPMHLKNFYKQKLEHYSKIRQDFFVTVLPRTKKQAKNFSPEILNNHIIICGIGINLKNILLPLRSTSMRNQQYPVVIMDKNESIPDEIWKEIEYFPDIYYIQGNPMKSKDLQKTGIKRAKAIIILSKTSSNHETFNMVDMVDMDTIFIYKAIKNETKSIMIIAELISVSALSFINSEANDENIIKEQGYWLSPSFAVGEIFIGSMLDTLICQAFYNPFITNILKQLIIGSAGANFSVNFQNKFNDKKIYQSTLYLLPIKEEIIQLGTKDYRKKMYYHEIFDIFVKNNMVPIGLYRNNKKDIIDKNNQPYVYICPNKDELVDIEFDEIYILAHEKNFTFSRSRKERVSRLSTYGQMKTAARLIDKGNDISLNLVQKAKKSLKNNSNKIRNIYDNKKICGDSGENMVDELNKMYDNLIEENKENSKEDEK